MLAILVGPCDMWIPLQAIVCAFSFLFHICLFISMSIMRERFPSFLKFLSLLFTFCLCFISSHALLLFPQTWHKQKKKGLINHFSGPKNKNSSSDVLLARFIWIDATCHCFKSVTVKVADLSAFGHNISPTHHILPVLFFIKVTDYRQRASVLEHQVFTPPTLYTLIHTCIEIVSLNPVFLMMCRQKVKGRSWVRALAVSES